MRYSHRLIELKVDFNGLYFWGSGWSPATASKWDEWLSTKMKSCFWRRFKRDNGWGESDQLVSTSASVYLHPMGFKVYIPVGEACSYSYSGSVRTETFPVVDELLEICTGLAEFCGGSITVAKKCLHEFDDGGTVSSTNLLT